MPPGGYGISYLKITALQHRIDGSSQISWRRASLLASKLREKERSGPLREVAAALTTSTTSFHTYC
jgi:hypothetical protein